jgi:hypothetical protein
MLRQTPIGEPVSCLHCCAGSFFSSALKEETDRIWKRDPLVSENGKRRRMLTEPLRLSQTMKALPRMQRDAHADGSRGGLLEESWREVVETPAPSQPLVIRAGRVISDVLDPGLLELLAGMVGGIEA